MKLTITGYSTALFSTWFFVEELGLLLDAGDGVAAGLLQKGGKVRHIFISHADRDHLTGLLQFNQLNARKGIPIIYYPKDCGSFPPLADFSAKFDPHVSGAIWKPIESGDTIEIKKGIFVEAIRNNHVVAPEGVAKSLSYKVYSSRRKLKPEFVGLSGNEIRELKEREGEAYMTYEAREHIISYSGDTPVEDYERWNQSRILIHEATFLQGETDTHIESKGNKHSTLEEVMEMVSQIEVDTLILSHFSSRYTDKEIIGRIKKLCEHYQLKTSVYAVLPGKVYRHILGGELVCKPFSCS